MAKKNHLTQNYLGLRASVLAVASCIALSGIPLPAQAAGLGKIVVFSALGQPLRAEIEFSATREELFGMKAQLASPDAFKKAGLDYATTLLGIRFSLDKRDNGQSVIKLSSDKPINDPFVDMLLELNWPTGRLVREYTFLLDPPEVTAKGPAPVAPVFAKPEAPVSKPSVTARTTSAIDDEIRSKAIARVRSQAAAPKSADQPAPGQDTYEVKRGDNLSKIASASKPDGVSLEQMLVALLRANQEAFDGGNMNRLKAGKILSLPEKSAIEAVPSGEARKIVIAQSSDWNAYRSKLAGLAAQTPAKEESARQESAGKITAKVESKLAASTEPKDQLKVSKTETAGSKPGGIAKRSDEDLIAKEKSLVEARDRLASLEKNVADLQKLVEVKNQNLADLQKQAAAKAVPVEVKKPAEEAKPPVALPVPTPVPAPVAAPVKAEPLPVTPAASEKAVEPAVKPELKPEEAPKPVEAAKPKAVPVPPAPPPVEPDFVDELLDNPLALAGGGGILALIAAYFISRRRRAANKEVPLDLNSTLSPQSGSLTANSVFRSTGGQSVDTSHTPVQTDFSQAGPGSIDTDEVDPVAEADVYMAYGRDAQAEEILLEAKQKDPKRYAIHLKLLEIYSNRKDTKQFEALATELYGETGGVGADWEKVAAMGLKLDPANPLFGNAAQPAPAPVPFDADATVIVAAKPMRNTVTLPGELSQLAEAASLGEPVSDSVAQELAGDGAAAAAVDLTSLDFDLGLSDAKPSPAPDNARAQFAETLRLPEPLVEAGALDFDLAAPAKDAGESVSSGAALAAGGLDFNLPEVSTTATPGPENRNEIADLDFDLGAETEAAGAEPAAALVSSNEMPEVLPVDNNTVEFDVNLTESTFLGSSMPEHSSFDMSSIDLDLKVPDLELPVSDSTTAEKVDVVSEASFDTVQVSTSVNPDFAAMQSETLINPQVRIDFDQAPDRDFLLVQSETLINTHVTIVPEQKPDIDFSTAQAETIVNPQFGVEQDDLAAELASTANEEVTTKLDLAKAYEEMGDLEGARELLQEVVKEGDASQREKAQAILSKIGN